MIDKTDGNFYGDHGKATWMWLVDPPSAPEGIYIVDLLEWRGGWERVFGGRTIDPAEVERACLLWTNQGEVSQALTVMFDGRGSGTLGTDGLLYPGLDQ